MNGMVWARGWVCLGVMGLWACAADLPGGSANLAQVDDQAPVISGMEARNEGNGIVTLRVRATDPTNSGLSYAWSVDEGTLLGRTGASVQWQPPKRPGTYTARVEVGSGRGGKRVGTQTFVVGADGVAKEVATSLPAPGSGVAASLTANGRPVFATPVPVEPIPVVSRPVFSSPTPVPPVLSPGVSPVPTATPSPGQPGVPILPGTIWRQYDPSKMPSSAGTLTGMHFTSDNRGWLVGAGGTVLLFNRLNATDEPSPIFRNTGLPSTVNFSDVHFLSDTTGFVAGDNRVFRTRDAGVSWEELGEGLPPNVNVSAMVVQGPGTVTVADSQGRVFRTLNADAPDPKTVFWAEFNTRPGDRPEVWTARLTAAAGRAEDPSLIYFVGDGIYQLDTDATPPKPVWSKLYSLNLDYSNDGDGPATAIALPLPGVIWVGTTGGNLLRSTDFGANWDRQPGKAFRNREHNGSPILSSGFVGPFLPKAGSIDQMVLFDVAGDLNRLTTFVFQRGLVYDSLDGGAQWRGLVSGFFQDVALSQVAPGDYRGWGLGLGNAFYRYAPR